MGTDNIALEDEIVLLKKTIISYEKIMKLNEQELANAEEIIHMYEGILEYSRLEMKDLSDVAMVREEISQLSRKELIEAINKIEDLEKQNKILREQKNSCGTQD